MVYFDLNCNFYLVKTQKVNKFCLSFLFFQFRIKENLHDSVLLKQKYNTSIDDVWKFVPKIYENPPFTTFICLIWTFPEAYKISTDQEYNVSSVNFVKEKKVNV